MYFVYLIVEKNTAKKYIGITNDLQRRLKQHNDGSGAKYTRKGDWLLVYYEAFLSKQDATMREYKLKNDGRNRRFLYQRAEKSITGQK